MKMTKNQRAFLESLKGEDGAWVECFYSKEWRTAKSLEKKGLIEILDDKETAIRIQRFEARFRGRCG